MWRPGVWRNLKAGAVVAVAALGLSCAGGVGDEGLTGPSMSPLPALDDIGAFEASGREATSLVCHNGRDLLVAPDAVPAHVAHGDTEGPCEAACPCFTAEQVAATAQCQNAVTQCQRSGGTYLCLIECQGVTHAYFLSPDSCASSQVSSPVDAAQHQMCFDILLTECPSFEG